MTLEELNSLQEEDCRKALFSCCGSTKWVEEMLSYRPFPSKEDLQDKAGTLFKGCNHEDWLEAFSHHARLGGRKKPGKSESEDLSQWEKQEQAGTAMAKDALLDKLGEANIEYKNKFGFIFLLCATGKSAAVMLESIYERLPNELNNELFIAMEEQNKITKLRIEKLLS